MSISLPITALIYLLFLVITYEAIIFVNSDSDNGEKIIIRAYNNAYFVIIIGLLFVYCLINLPQITIDLQTTTYLILLNKYISVLTLGVSFFVLSRKKYK